MIAEKCIEARAVIGFWPANTEGDDIAVFKGEDRKERLATLHTLRQQMPRRDARVNLALADFIAPISTKVPDYIGSFVVTAGIGEDAKSSALKGANNDYDAILLKGSLRPVGRGVCRAHASTGTHRILGLCSGRKSHE